MVRKLVIGAALAALVGTAAVSAASGARHGAQVVLSVSTTELMPGVSYTREVDLTAAGPVVLDVVIAPKPDGAVYSLAPVLSNSSLTHTAKLTRMVRSLDSGATTVAIDGDDFNPSTGLPHSILMRGGALDNAPDAGRASAGFAADGTLSAAQVALRATWQASAGLRKLTLNSRHGKFTLFTRAYGGRTPAESGTVAEAVMPSFPPSVAGQTLAGTVSQITLSGGTPIPRGGAVLVARDTADATQLETEAPVGQELDVRLTLTPDWSGLVSAIGGGPLLVENGKAIFSDGEAFLPGSLNGRAARGAIGQLADGRIVLVTAEATTSAYSIGISSYDLALELVRLGAVTAVGLGSGRQAGMAFNGALLTRPTGGSERSISDALVLSYTGVYASPVAPVLSPNRDGVGDTETFSYRLVRPSTVTAALTGPQGVTVPLASDAETVGVHTLSWDGTIAGNLAPEGTWTFSVTATDDRTVTTTAERTFSLDATLGFLTVGRDGHGNPAADFVLSRQADVVVTVERPNGIAVASFQRSALATGEHRVSWRGRIGAVRAPAGRYLMRVDATSTIGMSSLAAPFSLK